MIIYKNMNDHYYYYLTITYYFKYGYTDLFDIMQGKVLP